MDVFKSGKPTQQNIAVMKRTAILIHGSKWRDLENIKWNKPVTKGYPFH